ncbi:cysteine-rich CWC family protein [Polaromonas sp.]
MTAPGLPENVELPDSSRCPRCGAGLRCGMVTGDATCWCFAMPHAIPVPSTDKTKQAGCLCPACLQQLIDAQP